MLMLEAFLMALLLVMLQTQNNAALQVLVAMALIFIEAVLQVRSPTDTFPSSLTMALHGVDLWTCSHLGILLRMQCIAVGQIVHMRQELPVSRDSSARLHLQVVHCSCCMPACCR
jgi:hypothetical protein